MSDNRKDLPSVSAPNFLEKVREAMGTYLGNRGDKLDRGVTLRDLVDSNIITLRPGFLTGGGGGASPVAGSGTAVADAYETDLTPPPTPSGMTLGAAISHIFIGHAAPTYTQGHGHARTIVYGATWAGAPALLPTFKEAVKITEFTGTTFAHPSNPATTWHVWLKWQSVDGVLSTAPAGGTNGLITTTGQNVATLLTALTGQITQSQLFTDLGSRINLIDGASNLDGSVNARVLAETSARTSGDSANASSISTLSSQVNHATTGLPAAYAALQTEASTRASADGTLFAQYTVKVDVAGLVSGYGLASTSATPLKVNYSAFRIGILRAVVGLEPELTLFNEVISGRKLGDVVGDGGDVGTADAGIVQSYIDGLSITTAQTQYLAATVPSILLGNKSKYVDYLESDHAVMSAFGVRASQFFVAPPAVAQATQPSSNLYTGFVWLDTSVTPNVTRYWNGSAFTTAPQNLPFVVQASPTTVNGVPVPAGVYMQDAYIKNASIGQAKIGSVKADSITAGVLQAVVSQTGAMFNGVNAYAMTTNSTTGVVTAVYTGETPGTAGFGSGYYLGTLSGAAQFFVGSPSNHMYWNGSALTVRGTVFANAGLIGGNTIDASGLQSADYVAGSAGWRINSDGSVEFGSGAFRGSLSGATITGVTGTFSGSLSGANITGATGTFSGSISAGSVNFASSVGSTVFYNGAQTTTITVPANMTRVTVVLTGAGGGGSGGSNRSRGGGNGGGAGAETSTTLVVTPGQTFTLVLGSGGIGSPCMDAPYSYTYASAGEQSYIPGVMSAAGGAGGTLGGIPSEGGSWVSHYGADGAGLEGGLGARNLGQIGSTGGLASGGGGGTGSPAIYGNQPQGSAGGNGGGGKAVFEFFDPDGVVLKAPFALLKTELRNYGINVT